LALTLTQQNRATNKFSDQARHNLGAMVDHEEPLPHPAAGQPQSRVAFMSSLRHGCLAPKAAQLIKWPPVISWSRRLPNSREFS